MNDEVFYAADGIVTVRCVDIGELKTLAERNVRKRIRLCAHPDQGNKIHEMFIVLGKGNYIRPHRHPDKSESFHVVEGSAAVVIFDERGAPIECVELGDYSSGRRFYFRIDRPLFHSVVVRSDRFVFHETTNGPFNRSDTEFAPWAPEENDVDTGISFLYNMLHHIEVPHDS